MSRVLFGCATGPANGNRGRILSHRSRCLRRSTVSDVVRASVADPGARAASSRRSGRGTAGPLAGHGDADLALYKEVNSWTYAQPVVEKVWSRASKLGLNAFKPETGYAVMDDHIPLLAVGIPCIDLIDFDYPYWHTMEDTPDKCSAASLGQIGRLLVDLIYKND